MKKATIQGQLAIVLTQNSTNRKTGDMVQTWIIRNDMTPVEACKSGKDKAICGDCPHRGKSCYVNIGQAPQGIYKALDRGSYEGQEVSTKGKLVRCGAYGDPAFISLHIWKEILDGAKNNTGYTHQWRSCDPGFADFLMASCDSPEDRADAKAKGYRTFRVRRQGDPLLPGEIDCPADGMKITCSNCLKCNGNKRKGKDISIVVHGSRAKNF